MAFLTLKIFPSSAHAASVRRSLTPKHRTLSGYTWREHTTENPKVVFFFFWSFKAMRQLISFQRIKLCAGCHLMSSTVAISTLSNFRVDFSSWQIWNQLFYNVWNQRPVHRGCSAASSTQTIRFGDGSYPWRLHLGHWEAYSWLESGCDPTDKSQSSRRFWLL